MNTTSFSHLESIYRNYDIRGKFPEEITEAEVEKIGAAIVVQYGCKTIAIGRDIRPSADVLFIALAKGITSQGCNVVDLGLVTTPMTYFVCAQDMVDATVMITASHMPVAFNGLKISINDAKPVSSEELQKLRALVEKNEFIAAVEPGSITEFSPLEDWQRMFKQQFDFSVPRTIVVDPANMIGALDVETLSQFEALSVIPINEVFDAENPAHEANPVNLETLKELSAAVLENNADFGVAFDGDADRVGFVDENGDPVPADLIGALIAGKLLATAPGAPVVIDPRSSRSVEHVVVAAGGVPVRHKVGHSNIRTKMRELQAIIGIELAGHFFFKDTAYSEGGPLPIFIILQLLEETQKTLSELVADVRQFYHSGEINSQINRSAEEIYVALQSAYPEATAHTLDGLTLETGEWWCNVRPSANDPVMRLNVEANNEGLMEVRCEEILSIIRS